MRVIIIRTLCHNSKNTDNTCINSGSLIALKCSNHILISACHRQTMWSNCVLEQNWLYIKSLKAHNYSHGPFLIQLKLISVLSTDEHCTLSCSCHYRFNPSTTVIFFQNVISFPNAVRNKHLFEIGAMHMMQWIFCQQCGYWWLGALAPGHQ